MDLYVNISHIALTSPGSGEAQFARVECPDRLREQVTLRDDTCVFPFCTRSARKTDLDHVVPFDYDNPDPGGQTESGNLTALCRRHHRVNTHTRWRSEMPSPGVVLWTSPHGHRFRRDHTGTIPLGLASPREPRPRREPPPRYRGGGHLELVTRPPGEDPEQDAREDKRHGIDPLTFEEPLTEGEACTPIASAKPVDDLDEPPPC